MEGPLRFPNRVSAEIARGDATSLWNEVDTSIILPNTTIRTTTTKAQASQHCRRNRTTSPWGTKPCSANSSRHRSFATITLPLAAHFWILVRSNLGSRGAAVAFPPSSDPETSSAVRLRRTRIPCQEKSATKLQLEGMGLLRDAFANDLQEQSAGNQSKGSPIPHSFCFLLFQSQSICDTRRRPLLAFRNLLLTCKY
jgi:hypothetical protein